MLTNGPNLGLLVDGDAGEEHYSELMAQFRGFDALIQCNVLSATTTAEPGAPADGDSYIVPVGATGTEWAGEDGKVARWSDKESAWEFYTPREGWQAYSHDDNAQYLHDGSAWVLAYILGSVPNVSGTEFALWNPSGPVMGGLPANYLVSQFSEASDGARFGQRLKVLRAGSTSGAQIQAYSSLGTLSSPTASQSGNSLLTLTGIGFGATVARVAASMVGIARENFTDTAAGGGWDFRLVPLGSTTAITTVRFQASAGTAEILSIQATLRIIVGSTGVAFRDSTNSADTLTLNAAGTTFALPLATTVTFASATSFVVGTDPGGSALLRVGGSVAPSSLVLTGGLDISRAIGTSVVRISGGGVGLGGGLQLYGQSHATQANDIELRSATNVRGWWDDSAGLWQFSNATSTLTRFSTPAAGETALWLYDADNATLERVTVGAADSGGAGFKVLRIPN